MENVDAISSSYCVFSFALANQVWWGSRRWWQILKVFPAFTAVSKACFRCCQPEYRSYLFWRQNNPLFRGRNYHFTPLGLTLNYSSDIFADGIHEKLQLTTVFNIAIVTWSNRDISTGFSYRWWTWCVMNFPNRCLFILRNHGRLHRSTNTYRSHTSINTVFMLPLSLQ